MFIGYTPNQNQVLLLLDVLCGSTGHGPADDSDNGRPKKGEPPQRQHEDKAQCFFVPGSWFPRNSIIFVPIPRGVANAPNDHRDDETSYYGEDSASDSRTPQEEPDSGCCYQCGSEDKC